MSRSRGKVKRNSPKPRSVVSPGASTATVRELRRNWSRNPPVRPVALASRYSATMSLRRAARPRRCGSRGGPDSIPRTGAAACLRYLPPPAPRGSDSAQGAWRRHWCRTSSWAASCWRVEYSIMAVSPVAGSCRASSTSRTIKPNVDEHAAAGAAGNGSDHKDAQRARPQTLPQQAHRIGLRLRIGQALHLGAKRLDFLLVGHQAEAAERAHAFRLQRARDAVQPARVEPRKMSLVWPR